ncbi:hypothetical protein D3C76_1541910 [compost metagenome]
MWGRLNAGQNHFLVHTQASVRGMVILQDTHNLPLGHLYEIELAVKIGRLPEGFLVSRV